MYPSDPCCCRRQQCHRHLASSVLVMPSSREKSPCGTFSGRTRVLRGLPVDNALGSWASMEATHIAPQRNRARSTACPNPNSSADLRKDQFSTLSTLVNKTVYLSSNDRSGNFKPGADLGTNPDGVPSMAGFPLRELGFPGAASGLRPQSLDHRDHPAEEAT